MRPVLCVVSLLVVSSVSLARRMAALRKAREASEASRLASYVKYLSGPTSE